MIGIKAIASYVPAASIANQDRMEQFDVTEAFLAEKIGVRRVSRRADDEDTGDLCLRAFERLVEKLGARPASVDCVIVCTQNPHGDGLPHTSAIIHGNLDIGNRCACFDVSLGCTGYVHSLNIAKSFMEANGLNSGLLFTADPYSKIVDPDDRNTAMIFGDGAAVTYLSPASAEAPLFTPLDTRFHTEGARAAALENRAGTLHMDGRAVFNFSATAVPAQIKEMLADHNLEIGDVDLVLLHQGSKFIVDTIRKRLGAEEAVVPLQMAEHGNLVSSSIPVMFERYLDREDVTRVVLSGFGVGLSSATSLLERRHR